MTSMRSAAWYALPAVILCLQVGCTPPPPKIVKNDIGPGIGPFDSRGNYREDWADDPSKWRRPSTAVASNDAPPPRTSSPSSSQSSQSTRPTQPSQPKPTVTRHTVKRGDTLSHIARRYSSSVTAIRRAHGISGSLIYPGQKLIIPRR